MKGGNCFFMPYKLLTIWCGKSILKPLTDKEQVMMIVANECGVSIIAMKSRERVNTEQVEARFIAMWIIWKFFQPVTKIQIGRLFNKHHSSVIYALGAEGEGGHGKKHNGKIQDWLDTDPNFRSKMERCINLVNEVFPKYEAA